VNFEQTRQNEQTEQLKANLESKVWLQECSHQPAWGAYTAANQTSHLAEQEDVRYLHQS